MDNNKRKQLNKAYERTVEFAKLTADTEPYYGSIHKELRSVKSHMRELLSDVKCGAEPHMNSTYKRTKSIIELAEWNLEAAKKYVFYVREYALAIRDFYELAQKLNDEENRNETD